MAKKKQEIKIEQTYPGVTEQIDRYQKDEPSSCSHCGSANTANVMVGIMGRSITIAAETGAKLVPNVEDRLGTYWCRNCKKFFD
jgi:hypothetical protein